MKKVAIIGSTGSIGESALRVIEAAPDRFQVVGLAAGRNYELLAKQAGRHQPRLVSICDDAAEPLCALLSDHPPELAQGDAGIEAVAAMAEADVVLIAAAGAFALAPALAALKAGKTVALANKECLVMAGELIMAAARENGATIIPVDSEHSGVFQALAGRPVADLRRVILPASGGPFLDLDPARLERVTPEEALKHPKWSMGPKITIDSATLMNKALEIIEARWLFDLEPDRISVLIHPESVVHGIVEFNDGSMVAQLSVPDMRLPILHALAWPERPDLGLPRLDLGQIKSLNFRALDEKRFPAPRLALQALQVGGTAPAAFAAADEAAVEAFLHHRIPFTRIVPLIAEVLARHEVMPVKDVATALAADAWARAEVKKLIA